MKKIVALFLSALLVCSTLTSCATDSDPNKNIKNGAEVGVATGVGVGATAGAILGSGVGLICSIATLGLGTVPCMAMTIGGGVAIGGAAGGAIGGATGAGTGAVMDHNKEKGSSLPQELPINKLNF